MNRRDNMHQQGNEPTEVQQALDIICERALQHLKCWAVFFTNE